MHYDKHDQTYLNTFFIFRADQSFFILQYAADVKFCLNHASHGLNCQFLVLLLSTLP